MADGVSQGGQGLPYGSCARLKGCRAVVAGLSMSFAAFQAYQNTLNRLASLIAFATQVAWTMLGIRTTCAVSSVVERLLHTQEVAGSNPASRTIASMCLLTAFLQSFGANSANNFSKRGSFRRGSQYGSRFNSP